MIAPAARKTSYHLDEGSGRLLMLTSLRNHPPLCAAAVVLALATASFGAQSGSSGTQSATIQTDSEKPNSPDLPLSATPKRVVTVGFLLRHRSALNGRMVRVRGIIVSTAFGNKGCPPGRGMCMQPSVFLSDRNFSDEAHVLRVLLPTKSDEKCYRVNTKLTILGRVNGNRSAVVLDSSR